METGRFRGGNGIQGWKRVGLGWKWDPGVETGRFRGGNGIQGWKRVGLGVEMGSRGGNR